MCMIYTNDIVIQICLYELILYTQNGPNEQQIAQTQQTNIPFTIVDDDDDNDLGGY